MYRISNLKSAVTITFTITKLFTNKKSKDGHRGNLMVTWTGSC